MGLRNRLAYAITAAMVIAAIAGAAQAQPADTKQKAGAHFKQGEAYWKVKAYDQAIKEYEAAYALVPKPGFLFNIGLCYEELNDDVKALEHYQKYLTDAPEGRKATEARARSVQLERDIEKAREAAADAKAREEEAATHKVAIADKVGQAETAAGAGNYDEAIEAYLAAHEMSGDAEMLYRVADAYDQKGDADEAMVRYESYLAEAPSGASSVDARRNLKQLRDAAAAAQRAATTGLQAAAAPSPRRSNWSFGVKLGINQSIFERLSKTNEEDTCNTPNWTTSGQLGVSLTFSVNDIFGVQAEALLIQKASEVECESITDSTTVDTTYVEIPVLARFAPQWELGGIALYLGALIGFPIGDAAENTPGFVFDDPGPELGLVGGIELAIRAGPGQIIIDGRLVVTDQKYFAQGADATYETEGEATLMLMAGYVWR